jgi:N-acetylglucosaminyldiphosphoundecaprenol N-acetyl-beta-D-mannosaminyltransferase
MSVEILSVRLDGLDLESVRSRIGQFLTKDGVHQITPVNPEFIMATRRDLELREISNRSELTVADGVGLVFAARVLKIAVGERITGVDLTWEIARIASEKGASIFFLGASEGVAQKAAERLEAAYPSLKIAGAYSGTPEQEGIIDRVNASGADILLVAFGVPKQEKFISRNRNRLNVKIAMSVGGTFDFIAGVVPRAPAWMRSAGLEWLYRLIKQPQRINRIITATVRFPLAVLSDRVSGRSRNMKRSNHSDFGLRD